MQTVDW